MAYLFQIRENFVFGKKHFLWVLADLERSLKATFLASWQNFLLPASDPASTVRPAFYHFSWWCGSLAFRETQEKPHVFFYKERKTQQS